MTLEELKADIAKRYDRLIEPKDLNDALDVVKIEALIKKAQQRLLDADVIDQT